MSVRQIITYPDTRIKQCSFPVRDPIPSDFPERMIDLRDTFYHAPGCVGISAPQIGWLARVIIVDVGQARKLPKNSSIHGIQVCINPEIIDKSGSIRFREGCLSIPDFTGNVIRAQNISVCFLDETMERRMLDVSGFEAVVFQHEIDHLDGILFLDRVQSLKRDLFRRKTYLPPKDGT